VIALGAAVFLTATGGIGTVVASLGGSLEQAFGKLIASVQPTASQVVATDSPIIAAPENPVTNQPTAALRITVPAAVINTTAKVRVYVALHGLQMTAVQDVAVGSTTQVLATVQLTKGENAFSATILKDGVESAKAPSVTITLDQDPPKLTISSPKNGATVNDSTLTISGTTQPGSDLIAHNAANGASVTGAAGTDGKFSLALPISQGSNAVDVRSTDRAGNETSVTVTVKQGGDMKASVSANYYTLKASNLPPSLQVRVFVTDPSGAPLAGATAFFTITIPGLGPIQSGPKTTDAGGHATFTTSLVAKPTVGNGLITVLVSDAGFGDTTATHLLQVVK
jgi:hypothetical protein